MKKLASLKKQVLLNINHPTQAKIENIMKKAPLPVPFLSTEKQLFISRLKKT